MNKKILIVLLFIFLMFTTCVYAGGMISADTTDTIGYYGLDTPAGKSGYTYSICTDEGVFYMSDEQADKLGTHDYTLHKLVEYDLEKYSNTFTPDAVIFGRGGFNYVYNIDTQKDTDCFEISNNQEFSFDYKSGQQVGYNKDAKVVTKIYNPDGSVMI